MQMFSKHGPIRFVLHPTLRGLVRLEKLLVKRNKVSYAVKVSRIRERLDIYVRPMGWHLKKW